jgi:hypothetical protein
LPVRGAFKLGETWLQLLPLLALRTDLTEQWDGSEWSREALLNPSSYTLTDHAQSAVSCAAENACTAVGTSAANTSKTEADVLAWVAVAVHS